MIILHTIFIVYPHIMSNNITLIEKYLGHTITWYEIIAKWWDYEVILYDWMIYRFPRPDKIMDLELEKRKLDIIRPYISLPIPKFTIIDNTFIVYPVIKWTTFDECNVPFSDTIINTLTSFIKELHSVPIEKLDFMNTKSEQTDDEKKWFQEWVQSMKEDITKRLYNKVPAETIAALTTYMDELFFMYDSIIKAFVHTDIQWKNIIYDLEQNKISGIIDFTDSRIWWIELDFCHFAFRQDDVLEKMVTKYLWYFDKTFIERVEFLAKRSVIWEITNDEIYNEKFNYLIEQLHKYKFM